MKLWGEKIEDPIPRRINIAEINIDERIDILVKVNLVKQILSNADLNISDYEECIDIMTGGTFREPGQADKNTFKHYFETLRSLARDDVDASRFVIPINSHNKLLDGSHRLSVAIAKGCQEVQCLRIKDKEWKIDYGELAIKRHLSNHYFKWLKKSFHSQKNKSILVIWPKTNKKYSEKIINILKSDVTRVQSTFSLNITEDELRLIVLALYRNENWIGSIENKFRGILEKSKAVSQKIFYKNIKIVVLNKDHEYSDKIKREIRNNFKLNNDYIHSTDKLEDDIFLIDTIDAILKIRKNGYFKWKHNFINLQHFLTLHSKSVIEMNKIVIIGSVKLTLEGYRKNADIDYMNLKNNREKFYDSINNQLNLDGKQVQEYFKYDDNDYTLLGVMIASPGKNRKFQEEFYPHDVKKIIDMEFYQGKKA